MSDQCPLSEVKQTSRRKAAISAFDPKRTSDQHRLDMAGARSAYVEDARTRATLGDEVVLAAELIGRKTYGPPKRAAYINR